MNVVVEAREIACWYGQVVGVNDLTATIRPGITGLLGPNGAGKSTFMKLITGQLRPSRGAVTVLGESPFANARLYRRLGFCPDVEAVYDDMTARQFVSYLMRLHGYGRGESVARADRAIERVGLTDAASRRLRGFSKGMRQRVKLAQAIAHEPELVLLDEPLNGLDPVVRRDVLALLRELRDSGVHVLVSSHVLHEIESLTEEILLIHRGRILADGTVTEIRDLLDSHPRRIRFLVRDGRDLAGDLLALECVVGIELRPENELLVVDVRDVEALQRDLPAIVAARRPGIRSMECVDAGLEAVFDYLVG